MKTKMMTNLIPVGIVIALSTPAVLNASDNEIKPLSRTVPLVCKTGEIKRVIVTDNGLAVDCIHRSPNYTNARYAEVILPSSCTAGHKLSFYSLDETDRASDYFVCIPRD